MKLTAEEQALKELLDREALRINSPAFISSDPVQFPRMFDDVRDIETASLLVSTIAWGKRSMICRDCSKMLAMMDWQPYRYILEKGYEDLPEQNIHRTFFTRNLQHYLRGLREIYVRFGSLEKFAVSKGVDRSEMPAWQLASEINAMLKEANGCEDSRCLPLNIDHSALKRLNMALRWLVRDDGIVDLGIWKSLSPAALHIPLDVHVGNISRALGLLTRKANDRKAVMELTGKLRSFRPEDPVFYDFALFGLGIENSLEKLSGPLTPDLITHA